MFAKVSFISKTGLGTPYSYTIKQDESEDLVPMDYVVVTSARTDYTVGIFVGFTDEAPDEGIKLQKFVQRLLVEPYQELDLNNL